MLTSTHTSTFAGAPLACATAIATLDTVSREGLVQRSAEVGARFKSRVLAVHDDAPGVVVRGSGLMLGLDLGESPCSASSAQQRMLELGYITSTGGGARDVLVLTPPLTIAESQLEGAALALRGALGLE